ncbi:MAG: 3-phosphoshikimate 1-carboxyvinyltransferase [Solobacterium sp.]|nr:3-phosphoshikimate 1-carboxyvinyltransferase [Solobacterium sp.]
MEITVSRGMPADTVIHVPSSKSLSHRVLIAAALAEGTSRISRLADNEDIAATRRCIEAFGAKIRTDGNDLIVEGTGGRIRYDGRLIDCAESGSTLRFLIPIAAVTDQEVRFTGHGRLLQRPQTVYEEIFREQGCLFMMNDEQLKVRGPLQSGEYEIAGNISSQFITGLLYALPMLEGDSLIRVMEPFESRSYVNLTLSALKQAGIRIAAEGSLYRIDGGQKYQPFTARVEADASAAAFFIALAMLRKVPLTIAGLNPASAQGDLVMVKIAERLGAETVWTEEGCRIIPHAMKAVEADLSDCPDLGPVLFAAAARAEGTSVFRGAGRLRLKESDRIQAMEEELARLGVQMTSDQDTVYVTGTSSLRNAVLSSHNDHRIVMALSVLAASSDEKITIRGCEAVAKSYPDFFSDLQKTGAYAI